MPLDTARYGRPGIGAATLRRAVFLAVPLTVMTVIAGPALAQRDDPGLQLNCANDFFRLCAGVDPQSPQADACMNRNRPRLSPECKAAVGAYESGGSAKRGRAKE